MQPSSAAKGFTLIELSIVLVIIGLIVGGVLVGRDLIAAAEIRATVSQIEKYRTAVNTFRVKYGYLPGDMPGPAATSSGFTARGTDNGAGNGNGILEGWQYGYGHGCYEGAGETAVFWRDLSDAQLIDGGFNKALETNFGAGINVATKDIGLLFPAAKIGKGNYVYVFSGGVTMNRGPNNGVNYFEVANVTGITSGYILNGGAGMTPLQAFAIDNKMDDGMPQSGAVLSQFATEFFLGSGNSVAWIAAGGEWGMSSLPPGTNNSNGWMGGDLPTTKANTADSNSCYDNGGVTGPQKYSVAQSGINCALSFSF